MTQYDNCSVEEAVAKLLPYSPLSVLINDAVSFSSKKDDPIQITIVKLEELFDGARRGIINKWPAGKRDEDYFWTQTRLNSTYQEVDFVIESTIIAEESGVEPFLIKKNLAQLYSDTQHKIRMLTQSLAEQENIAS